MEALEAPDPAARRIASSTLPHPELANAVFAGVLAGRGGVAERMTRAHLAEAPAARGLDAALFLDARLGLVDDMPAYFDRASMACSLEVRVPFLDHELVELRATVPAAAKVNNRPPPARAVPALARDAGALARRIPAACLRPPSEPETLVA